MSNMLGFTDPRLPAVATPDELLGVLEARRPFPKPQQGINIGGLVLDNVIRVKDRIYPPGMSHVFMLTGPSGVGKDAVLDTIACRGFRHARARSATTRPPRPGEPQDSHLWMDVGDTLVHDGSVAEVISELVSRYGLIECAFQSGAYYGLPASSVTEALQNNPGTPVVIKTDIEGAKSAHRALGATANVTVINIVPETYQDLWGRIQGRGDEIQRLVEASQYAVQADSVSDFVVVNANNPEYPSVGVTRTTQSVETIISAVNSGSQSGVSSPG